MAAAAACDADAMYDEGTLTLQCRLVCAAIADDFNLVTRLQQRVHLAPHTWIQGIVALSDHTYPCRRPGAGLDDGR